MPAIVIDTQDDANDKAVVLASEGAAQRTSATETLKAGAARLVLEELPQLVEEELNSQESIFTTLANRSTSCPDPLIPAMM